MREHNACAKGLIYFELGGFYTKNIPKSKSALADKEINFADNEKKIDAKTKTSPTHC